MSSVRVRGVSNSDLYNTIYRANRNATTSHIGKPLSHLFGFHSTYIPLSCNYSSEMPLQVMYQYIYSNLLNGNIVVQLVLL